METQRLALKWLRRFADPSCPRDGMPWALMCTEFAADSDKLSTVADAEHNQPFPDPKAVFDLCQQLLQAREGSVPSNSGACVSAILTAVLMISTPRQQQCIQHKGLIPALVACCARTRDCTPLLVLRYLTLKQGGARVARAAGDQGFALGV